MQKLEAIHRREGSYIEQQKAEVVANTSKTSNTQLTEQHQRFNQSSSKLKTVTATTSDITEAAEVEKKWKAVCDGR